MSKPSERCGVALMLRVKQAEDEYRQALAHSTGGHRTLTDEEWAKIRERPHVVKIVTEHLADYALNALIEELDRADEIRAREEERRAAWEKKIEARLNKIAPGEF